MGVLGAFLFNSCSTDDDDSIKPVEVGTYSDGFFVLNEGVQAAGTVTYVSDDFETVENAVYQANNEDDDLGLFLQSMFFYENNAFIISNGSNVITVVDRNTFELVGKVESDLSVPYYAAVIDGKAYVTNLASFDTTDDDYVAVVDLETLEITRSIELAGPAENILADDQYVYVQNSSFGTGNSISVIDPATNAVIETIQVNDGLTDIEIENDVLYVLSSGAFETINLETRETTSKLNFSADLQGVSNLDIEDGTAYFTLRNKVYAMPVSASEAPEDALLEYSSDSEYGIMYGFEVENNMIYIGDAGDFQSDGFVQIYTLSGDLLKEMTAGVAPNGFFFNE